MTNTQGKDGLRTSHVAFLRCNLEVSHHLLEQNAHSRKAGMDIAAATRFGFLDLLQRFEAKGDDIIVTADKCEISLHVACESGQAATLQYLCEHGTLLDLQDNSGNTAMHMAVSNSHLDVTGVLLEKGTNLCAANASDSTAPHTAVKSGYLNIVHYLTEF